ncbi:putative prophage protein [Stanieria sp. NIES-3757]|nr:putative prophage protein [Stanieria sp. NIES-3757]
MDVLTLSKYIVHQFSQQSPDGITPMKLQKLLFYVKAWTLVAGNQLVFADFEHWDYGPVNRDIYDYYKQYGGRQIEVNDLKELNISQAEKELIDFIIENYIEFDAFTLSAMTHTEEPWKQTKKNQVISDELISAYYSKQRFAKNFEYPLDLENNPFYSLEDYSFEMDMSEEDAEEIAKYSSYTSYKKLLNQAEHDFESQWSSLALN